MSRDKVWRFSCWLLLSSPVELKNVPAGHSTEASFTSRTCVWISFVRPQPLLSCVLFSAVKEGTFTLPSSPLLFPTPSPKERRSGRCCHLTIAVESIALFWYLIFSLRPTIRRDEDCIRWRCVHVCVYVCDPLVGYGSSMHAKQSRLGANLCGIEQHPMQWVGSHRSNFSQLILSVKIYFSWIFYQTCVWETVGERKKLEMH